MRMTSSDLAGGTSGQTARSLATAVAFASLAVATHAALADRGRGSIRAEARPEPARQPEAVRAEPQRVQVDVHQSGPPPVHVDVQVHRDWDDNDESPERFGGFAKGSPQRVIRGQRFHDLPPGRVDISFHNAHFFFDPGGAFYQQQNDGEYLVVQPPIGIAVAAVPDGTVPIVVGPTTYYYLDGVFYVSQDGAFAVVGPPPGIVVPALPSGASQVIVNGTVLYQFNGFNYQPSLQDGVTVYTVTPS